MEYIWIQTAFVSITCILLLIFARSKPETPPSRSASKVPVKFSFKDEFKNLIHNKNYVILALIFGCLYSNTGAMSAVISSVTKPFGFKGADNAIIGSVFIISGIFGSFLGGFILDKQPKFKRSVICISIIGLLFYGCLMLSLETSNLILVATNFGLIGFTVVPILPISFAFAIELSYPVPDPMSNGMMLLVSKIYGAVLGIAAGFLSKQSAYYAILLFVVNALISALCSFFVKEDLRRLKMTQ